jgi:hypothetical protein
VTRAQLEALRLKYGKGEVNEVINTLFEYASALAEAQPGDASSANVDDENDWAAELRGLTMGELVQVFVGMLLIGVAIAGVVVLTGFREGH